MVLPEYKNLTESELVFADHYAETGNWSALVRMRETSAKREAPSRPLSPMLYDDEE